MAHYWFWPPAASLEVVYGIYDMDLEQLNLVAAGLWRSSVLPALENGIFGTWIHLTLFSGSSRRYLFRGIVRSTCQGISSAPTTGLGSKGASV